MEILSDKQHYIIFLTVHYKMTAFLFQHKFQNVIITTRL